MKILRSGSLVVVAAVLAAVWLPSRAADLPQAAPMQEIFDDWLAQDAGADAGKCFRGHASGDLENRIVGKVLSELGREGRALRARLAGLRKARAPGSDARWRALYTSACRARRVKRLAPVLTSARRIVFTKHHTYPSSNVFYTEALSDAQSQRNFKPDSALCILEMDGPFGRVRTLLADAGGMIRDPDVSHDGRRILFAWKKSRLKDDYHLYEMLLATGGIRRLTGGLGFADYEGKYLPGGGIIFSSTRCVQTVDCNYTEVSNLYLCDGDGRYMRRVGFDQVHTTSPAVTPDGRIIYTRWDYNDRGQVFTQPLFQMNPDGTAQTECYGNNSWFPTTIQFARGIPGSSKLVAILPGHHTKQAGKLAIIDLSKGRQEGGGVQLIAPVRPTEPLRQDRYGQKGGLFQYPYPLSETEFLVTYAPRGWAGPVFGIYFMTIDGRRELLAADATVPCSQPVPLRPRRRPPARPDLVDYRQDRGVYYMQDVYAGAGLKGVPRLAAKKIRVVALEFRASGIGRNHNRGPAGRASVSSPVSIDNGSWDVKRVLGTAKIEADGSACFTVPARTPVYFQVLDARNHVIQTMRSWSTLQPGERFSCVGCHEHKNQAPPRAAVTLAMRKGPRKLTPFYGPARGFSFTREIQPILDRHCVKCHTGQKQKGKQKKQQKKPFSLRGRGRLDKGAKRIWSESYLALTNRGKVTSLVNWISPQSGPAMLRPYHAGAAKSKLIAMLEKGHNKTKLSREELDKIACWIDLLVPFCGDYREANAWSEAEKAKYDRFENKRKRMQAVEERNIQQLINARAGRM